MATSIENIELCPKAPWQSHVFVPNISEMCWESFYKFSKTATMKIEWIWWPKVKVTVTSQNTLKNWHTNVEYRCVKRTTLYQSMLFIVERWAKLLWKLATLLQWNSIRFKAIFRWQVCEEIHTIQGRNCCCWEVAGFCQHRPDEKHCGRKDFRGCWRCGQATYGQSYIICCIFGCYWWENDVSYVAQAPYSSAALIKPWLWPMGFLRWCGWPKFNKTVNNIFSSLVGALDQVGVNWALAFKLGCLWPLD